VRAFHAGILAAGVDEGRAKGRKEGRAGSTERTDAKERGDRGKGIDGRASGRRVNWIGIRERETRKAITGLVGH
jgi:hypothetical protein